MKEVYDSGWVFEGVEVTKRVFDQCCEDIYLAARGNPACVVLCQKDHDALKEEIWACTHFCGPWGGSGHFEGKVPCIDRLSMLVNQTTGRIMGVHVHSLPRGTMYFGDYHPEWFEHEQTPQS